jgi:DNA-binding beta-propeller fold protein YncE
MRRAHALGYTLGLAIVASFAMPAERLHAQGAGAANPNAAPNPYHEDTGWAKLAAGRKWGAAVGVEIDPDGKSVWVFDRCATADDCSKAPNLDPIQKFDAAGNLVFSFGKGLINYPHGLYIDADKNIWVSDGRALMNGKGHTVMKYDAGGKLLMTLGEPGIAGNDEKHFNAPSDILIAPNGDIFIADGHGGETNARVVKFDRTGKFIKAWGKKGKGPGDFDAPHGLAMDSQGRLYVADRSNSRIQIFDQDGKFLEEWRQFGRPSGIYIDKNDVLYAADSESAPTRNQADWHRGIRVGSARDGKVTAFIPDPWKGDTATQPATTAPEGVAADAAGNVYGGEVTEQGVKKYAKR